MIKTILKEVKFCDVCFKELDYGSTCKECGKIMCYECSVTNSKTYNHSVHCSGSEDGVYCTVCINKLYEKPTPLFLAYLNIKNLRNEATQKNIEFEKACNDAEQRLKELQRK